jgi:DNA transformation protein and related proteins
VADESLKEFVADQLRELPGLRFKRMFGGYGLYGEELFFGILLKGKLYFKTDEQTRAAYTDRGMAPFSYEKTKRIVSVHYFEVPPDVLEDRDMLLSWAQLAIQVSIEETASGKPGRRR